MYKWVNRFVAQGAICIPCHHHSKARGVRDPKSRPRVVFFFSQAAGGPTNYVSRSTTIYGKSCGLYLAYFQEIANFGFARRPTNPLTPTLPPNTCFTNFA